MATKKTAVKKTTTKTTSPQRIAKKSSSKKSVKTTAVNEPAILSTTPHTSSAVSAEKKRQVNKTALIVGIIVVILILLYIFRTAFVVGFVNGQPITTAEFNHQLEKDAGKQAINEILTKDLIFQEAAKKHITISDKEVNAQVASIENTLKTQHQTLDSALAAKNLTRQDLIDQIKIKLIVDKILGPQVKVSDKEVQDYIDQNKDSLPSGEATDQLKTSIKDRLMQDKLSQKFQDWIDQLQRNAKINYLIKI